MQSPNPKLFMYINDRIVLMLIKQRQVHWLFKKKLMPNYPPPPTDPPCSSSLYAGNFG